MVAQRKSGGCKPSVFNGHSHFTHHQHRTYWSASARSDAVVFGTDNRLFRSFVVTFFAKCTVKSAFDSFDRLFPVIYRTTGTGFAKVAVHVAITTLSRNDLRHRYSCKAVSLMLQWAQLFDFPLSHYESHRIQVQLCSRP